MDYNSVDFMSECDFRILKDGEVIQVGDIGGPTGKLGGYLSPWGFISKQHWLVGLKYDEDGYGHPDEIRRAISKDSLEWVKEMLEERE